MSMRSTAILALRTASRSALIASHSQLLPFNQSYRCYYCNSMNEGRMRNFSTSTLLYSQTTLTSNVVSNPLAAPQSSLSQTSASSQLVTPYETMKHATPAATPGGVDLSEMYTHDIAQLEHRRRTITRASDEQRRGIEPLATRYKNTLHKSQSQYTSQVKHQQQQQQAPQNNIGDQNATSITSKHSANLNSEKVVKAEEWRSQKLSAVQRWWPYNERDDDAMNLQTKMYHGRDKRELKRYDGMFVPQLKEVLRQDKPEEISLASQLYGKPDELTQGSNTSSNDKIRKPQKSFPAQQIVDETPKRLRHELRAPTFDPTLDNTDELLQSCDSDMYNAGYIDYETIIEINKAAEADQAKLNALANPLTMQKQLQTFIAPIRHNTASAMQRSQFNGFAHWGLLQRANTHLTQNLQFTKARHCVNQYIRDMDLFVKWLEHPKVVAHIKNKFKTQQPIKYDKDMAMVMSFYTLGKIAVYQDNPAEALKSFHNAIAIIHERGNLSIERHRRAYGYNLLARGAIYCKLQSYERAEDDLTRCIAFMQVHKFPIIYELRAEAREQLGNIDGAREDEQKAAELWEKGEVVCDPVTGEQRKLVI